MITLYVTQFCHGGVPEEPQIWSTREAALVTFRNAWHSGLNWDRRGNGRMTARQLLDTELESAVVKEVRRRMDGFDLTKISGACLYWAQHTVNVLTELGGPRAIIQAGSTNWRFVSENLDDGICNTHFAYEFHAHEAMQYIRRGIMPEIHCWCVLPDYPDRDNPTFVDLTTRYIVRNAAEAGIEWKAELPPDHLWCEGNKLPAIYRADPLAIAYALMAIRSLPKETWS